MKNYATRPKPYYKRCMHGVLNETDAPSVGLVAGILQIREDLNCLYNEVAEITALCFITFTSKNPSSVETR